MNFRIISPVAAGIILCAGAAAAAPAKAPAGDPAKGRSVFVQQCSLCHSPKAGEEGQGPSLYGVVGRKSGSEAGFPAYSRSLKSLNVTWQPASLDRFLSDPNKLAPGTAMPINVANAQDRKNVIAYLASLKKAS
jgi:cytochrome c